MNFLEDSNIVINFDSNLHLSRKVEKSGRRYLCGSKLNIILKGIVTLQALISARNNNNEERDCKKEFDILFRIPNDGGPLLSRFLDTRVHKVDFIYCKF